MGFPLKSLPAVPQGSSTTRILQGQDLDGSIPTVFLASDVLSATVWLAQGEPSLATPTVTWFNSDLCQFMVSLSGDQTNQLTIDTTYNLQVFATRDGTEYCIGWVYLPIAPAAAAQPAASPPDLVTGTYAARLLSLLGLKEKQLEAIPTLITYASAAIRQWCFNNYFTQTTWTEEYLVYEDNYIRFNQVPVNQVLRVRAVPTDALYITNNSPDVQVADAYFTATGDVTSGLVVTGITLNQVSNGTATITNVPYVTGMVLSDLVTAIVAVGSGWGASTNTGFDSWAVTELMGGNDGQGCLIGQGAAFQVWSTDLNRCRFYPERGRYTGLFEINPNSYSSGMGPTWGWGPGDLDGGFQERQFGRVQVTYNAGYATIPPQVQKATVELVKAALFNLGKDLSFKSEKAKDYQYELRDMIESLPFNVRQDLSQYRIHNA